PRNVRPFTLEGVAPEAVAVVAASADGKWLATGGNDGQIKLWDAATGAPLRAIAAHAGVVSSLTFSADGIRLFSGSHDKTVRMWQVADGAALGGVSTPAAINAIALCGDGAHVAAGGADNLVRVWDAAAVANPQISELAPAVVLSGHAQPITSVAGVPG